MRTLIQDLRHGARILIRNPGFAAAAVIALALGSGANIAVLSVVDALVLNPLPFPDIDRLVSMQEVIPGQGLKATAVAPANFLDWRERSGMFERVAAYRVRDAAIAVSPSGGTRSEPELVRGTFVTSDFLPALRVAPQQGRAFTEDEDALAGGEAALIGHGLWQRRYAGDPSILGTSIIVDDRACTIVGVMPPGFDFPFGTEVWRPLVLTPAESSLRDRRTLYVLARLLPGVALGQARAGMSAVAARLAQEHPATNAGVSVIVEPLRDLQGAFTRPLLAVLVGMSAFLLLIACTNVAHLLFARATVRSGEMAIRAALGASRWRMVRQLMTEGLLLSLVSGGAGLLLAIWAVDVVKAALPPDIASHMVGWNRMQVDGPTLLLALAATTAVTLLFSLAPALRATRGDLHGAFREGATATAGGRERRHRDALVAIQVAFTLMLLAGAGLMIAGFRRIVGTLEEARPEQVLALRALPQPRYSDNRTSARFYEQVLQEMQALPDVVSATLASNTPLNNSPNPAVELVVEGGPPLEPGERRSADLVAAAPDYFPMIGAPLLLGRDFASTDGPDAPPVAIVSEAAALRYWPAGDPVGRRVRLAGDPGDGPWITIVGVAADVRQSWFDRDVRPQIYRPYRQAPRPRMWFLLRTAGDPAGAAAGARACIRAADRDLPADEVKTLARLIVDEASPLRFAADLMMAFGVMALLLAAVGVYGVMSYAAARRTREIGIRMAMGATRRDVLGLIMRRGAITAAAGLGLGLALAYTLGRVMTGLLYGVVALEAGVIAAYAILLAGVTILSCYLPARRAAGADPMAALREE